MLFDKRPTQERNVIDPHSPRMQESTIRPPCECRVPWSFLGPVLFVGHAANSTRRWQTCHWCHGHLRLRETYCKGLCRDWAGTVRACLACVASHSGKASDPIAKSAPSNVEHFHCLQLALLCLPGMKLFLVLYFLVLGGLGRTIFFHNMRIFKGHGRFWTAWVK